MVESIWSICLKKHKGQGLIAVLPCDEEKHFVQLKHLSENCFLQKVNSFQLRLGISILTFHDQTEESIIHWDFIWIINVKSGSYVSVQDK